MLLRSRYAGLSGGLRSAPALHGRNSQYKSHERQPVVHARDRRRQTVDEAEDAPVENAAPEPQVVRSARRGLSERRSNRIMRTGQQAASPLQTLRDMNIVTADENGEMIVDLSCLGRNEPHWYAVGIVENKEQRYLEMFAEVCSEYGVVFDPEALYTPPRPGDAAAAAEADALLQENEVVAWIPSKTMMVYSHNTDKLVERTVHYGRGTGGAWLMLHMTLSPLLVDLVQETYYYLGWRHEQAISARMLEQAGILPRGEDPEEVYKLPIPCTADVIQQLIDWQYTEENEDLEEKRTEYYGIGSGSVFGELPSKAERLKGMERDAAGNIVQKRYGSGTYDNPSGWKEGPGSSSSRGGRGGSRGGRGGRGQAGRGRDSWQQQQQPLPWEQQQWAAADSDMQNNRNNNYSNGGGRDPSVRLQQMDYMQEMGSGRYNDDDADWQQPRQQQQQRGAFNNRDSYAKPRDDSVRHRQMDYMQEMGSGRYSDEDEQDLTGYNTGYNRQGQAGFSGRGDYEQSGFRDSGKTQPRGAGYVNNRGSRGKGDSVRQRQMDYMQEMGSGRYSDDDGSDVDDWSGAEGRGTAARGGRAAAAAAPRDDRVRHRQMDYMEEMGSERYSSSGDDDDSYNDPDYQPSGRARGSSRGARGSSSSGGRNTFISDVASAFEGYDQAGAAFLAQQQQPSFGRQQQQQQGKAAGPGKASFMDEDSLAWGDDNAAASTAAARQQYSDWRKDTGASDPPQGFGFSDLDSMDFTDDKLLQQLAQMPPNDIVPSKKGRAKSSAATAGATVGSKASKKSKKSDRNAAAKGFSEDTDLGLGGLGSDDDGFERGWVDRIMSDGNDKVGLDDIMKE